ncbi:MAG: AI-2E family transporter [bacterium]|nr:AI-2E family transporter [bacterium]
MKSNQPPVHVNISSLTIIKVMLVFLGLAFLWAIRDIIAIVFVAWVLASALDPLVDRMNRYKVPRALGIFSVYMMAAIFIAVVLALLVPSVTTEISGIARDFPHYYEPIRDSLSGIRQTGDELGVLASIQEGLDSTVKSLTNLSSGLYGAVASFFGGIITVIGILVIAFYMTVEEEGIKMFIQSVAPANYQPYVIRKINQIQKKLSSWLWGQMILMLFVGLLSGVSLWILGVKYALVLGLLAGLTEFIPIVGPLIAAVPAIFFALTDVGTAPYKPLLVILIFVVIQQVENQLLVPRVMKKAVGLNPIIVIITLLIGAKLGGLVGVILAVPLVTILGIFLEDFFEDRKNEQNKIET